MAIRGEIFSSQMQTEKRTYFFNVKEDRTGSLFLNLVESKKMPDGSFDRHSIMVFQEDINDFMREFNKASRILSVGNKQAHHSDRIERNERFESKEDNLERDTYSEEFKPRRHFFDKSKSEGFSSRKKFSGRGEKSERFGRSSKFDRNDSRQFDSDRPKFRKPGERKGRLRVRVRRDSEAPSMDE